MGQHGETISLTAFHVCIESKIEPFFIVHEAGGIGRGIGLEADQVAASVAPTQTGGQLPNDRYSTPSSASGVEGPDYVGSVLLGCSASHFAQGSGLLHRDVICDIADGKWPAG